jgi:hypothetical protein
MNGALSPKTNDCWLGLQWACLANITRNIARVEGIAVTSPSQSSEWERPLIKGWTEEAFQSQRQTEKWFIFLSNT